MQDLHIKQYTPKHLEEWNNFLGESKNATFLFNRHFMDYHSDRFMDNSLLLYHKNNIVALLPCNRHNATVLVSHGGLTYGGLILHKNVTLLQTIHYFVAILHYLKQQGFQHLLYKQLPSFYTQQNSYEEEYALFLLDASLIRRDTAFVINRRIGTILPYQERRRRSLKKALAENVSVQKDNDFAAYWEQVLIPNLWATHGVKPVHTLPEIVLLAERFPDNIAQYNAYQNGQIVAGITLFVTETAAHAQYISANEQGKTIGAIDLVTDTILRNLPEHISYFSLGITNENDGKYLNKGLAEWKEGFGCRAWSHNFYEISIDNYHKLVSVCQK